jgi:protein-tyrosine phosphatase
VEGVYIDTVDQSCSRVAALFTLLQQPDVYPVLIHCRAGRDRTGFISIVIQLALGVRIEDIVGEYLRSDAYVLPQAHRAVKVIKAVSLGLFKAQSLRAVFASQERYAHTVIGKIEGEYGGIAAYLAQCGVSTESVAAVKDILLEKLPPIQD